MCKIIIPNILEIPRQVKIALSINNHTLTDHIQSMYLYIVVFTIDIILIKIAPELPRIIFRSLLFDV